MNVLHETRTDGIAIDVAIVIFRTRKAEETPLKLEFKSINGFLTTNIGELKSAAKRNVSKL